MRAVGKDEALSSCAISLSCSEWIAMARRQHRALLTLRWERTVDAQPHPPSISHPQKAHFIHYTQLTSHQWLLTHSKYALVFKLGLNRERRQRNKDVLLRAQKYLKAQRGLHVDMLKLLKTRKEQFGLCASPLVQRPSALQWRFSVFPLACVFVQTLKTPSRPFHFLPGDLN